ncbi:hypothetical protein SAMN05216198_1523 [Halopseudomonas litoralis]|uniref:Morphogenetic protein n=1 Tax=Halopseudomonas litoralis TaxID=797277 RepID=A0A1H1QLU8_9GAMM|nr:hypothetical protein [Halopseudomonas litoralis]SDS24442.1 hypothetical protein SAMN05216198_1523 [Halopseudomonas litoralis]
MTERPILFNGEMVSAILDGRKTVARRVMKPQPEVTPIDYPGPAGHRWPANKVQSMVHVEQELQNQRGGWEGLAGSCCPYGQVGDHLWVRETWAETRVAQASGEKWVVYREADNRTDYGGPWKPSIHMPRWASRIQLEITGVRVERLQEITIGQICKEGLARSMYEFIPVTTAFDAFAELWNSTGGDWDANPWVWVIEFKRIDQ